MQLIPVLDLLNGQVVQARHGQRQHYQAVKSSLCAGSSPLEILAALQTVYPFPVIYLADLDALQGKGNHLTLVRELLQAFPDSHFWLDAGADPPTSDDRIMPVFGTESWTDAQDLLSRLRTNPQAILSLDFKAGSLLGPVDILQQSQHWPRRVIVMELDAVGSQQGPFIERLMSVSRQSPGTQFYAAGGIRNEADVNSLAAIGCHGALLASALHNGQFSRRKIQQICSRSR